MRRQESTLKCLQALCVDTAYRCNPFNVSQTRHCTEWIFIEQQKKSLHSVQTIIIITVQTSVQKKNVLPTRNVAACGNELSQFFLFTTKINRRKNWPEKIIKKTKKLKKHFQHDCCQVIC